jgi:PIN domain nuclease of toxin-antitoxin system
MKLLLDSHTFYWWDEGDNQLSQAAKDAILDPANEKFISAATVWEMTIKYASGKESGFLRIITDTSSIMASHGFRELPITIRDAQVAGSLPVHHRDPFDRMLVAQSIVEGMRLVSSDAILDKYAATRLW